MSLQKSNKKTFKSPFSNPLKHSAIHPERNIQFKKYEVSAKDQFMEKTTPPTETKKLNIKKSATNNSRQFEKDLNKKEKKAETKKLPMTSLTESEYDDIFSSAINRSLTGGIPSPVMEHNTEGTDNEDEIENRAAIPEPNEAQSPQEVAERPMEYIRTEVHGKQAFSRKKKIAQTTNVNTHVSEVTLTKHSFPSNKTNKKKVPPSPKPNLPFLPVLPKDQENLQTQRQMNRNNQEQYEKHTNAHHDVKTACKETDRIPKMKQKPNFNKHQETGVKGSFQLSQSNSFHSLSGSHSKHSTQCSHHSLDCGHVCKKKHSQNCSNLTQDTQIYQNSVIQKSGSQNQYSQGVLSQPGPELSLKERLLWLQKRRDVGLWVQCSRPVCNKWRYLNNTRDPVDVPQEWFCHMNPDKKYNSCAAPEKPPTPLEEEDLIHNIYTAGSVVWGRLVGFPWWPAMVDDDPDTEQYYWLNSFSDIPTYYNVVFFDEKDVTHAWLTPGAMRPFTGQENSKEFRKTTANGIDYAKRLQVARLQAQKALPMGIGERLKNFGFLARYKGPIGSIKKKQMQYKRRKCAEDEDITSFWKDNDDEHLTVYRDQQEEKNKGKPKRKGLKYVSVSEPIVKKKKVQAANNERNETSSKGKAEMPKMNNEVHGNKASEKPKPTFSGSLYTQELSNREPDSSEDKSFSDTNSKPQQTKSSNEGSGKRRARQYEADSSEQDLPTKAENVSLTDAKNKEPSTINERKKITGEMQILSDDDSETQFSAASNEDEDIINCSQDFFSSQNEITQWNKLQKSNTNTDISNIAVVGQSIPSTSNRFNINVTEPFEESKASETTTKQMKTTNSVLIGDASSTSESIEAVNDTEQAVNGDTNSPTQSVLQPGTSNPSTSIASHSNFSDGMPLVPDSQHNIARAESNQLVHANSDAVVPQLNAEVSDIISYSSVDFEAEE